MPSDDQASALRVASKWVRAQQGALWERFLDEVYEGGKKKVRNTNRDTKDKYPEVATETLLKTDRKFRKLLMGQFNRWKTQQGRQGPQGEPVTDLSELKEGQTLEWGESSNPTRGVVEKARGNRAILKLENGKTHHMRPWDLEMWKPRVV